MLGEKEIRVDDEKENHEEFKINQLKEISTRNRKCTKYSPMYSRDTTIC